VEDGKLTMEIYIDRSLVEGFFNSYKAISIRAYVENPTSQAISLFANGDVAIESLYVAAMGSIFE
jgi:sucrose-6-phosphate hydrolase SacC (GH32 family)